MRFEGHDVAERSDVPCNNTNIRNAIWSEKGHKRISNGVARVKVKAPPIEMCLEQKGMERRVAAKPGQQCQSPIRFYLREVPCDIGVQAGDHLVAFELRCVQLNVGRVIIPTGL